MLLLLTLASLTTFAIVREVKRKPAKTTDYGVVIGTRLTPEKARKVRAIARSKSSALRTVRPADILRVALVEYIDRHTQSARAAA